MTASLVVGVAAGCWRDGDPGTCNDGIEDPGEECDDGLDNRDPDTTPPGECTWECKVQPGCGDKKEDTGEECDHGRTGSEWCTNECKRNPGCGDKIQDEGEECDHGPDNRPIEIAAEGDCTAVSCKEARCGNGQTERGEECDNGTENLDTLDATANQCTLMCQRAACGDGKKNRDEVCDDGNPDDNDGCPNNCSCEHRCGNSIPESVCGEECDRGPDGDESCTENCRNHTCGDGIVGGKEQCDNGDDVDLDTCTELCLFPGVCGNQVIDIEKGEECDDGNMDDSDECVEGCKKAECGDGFVWIGTEVCDDGKNDGSYGSCSKECDARGPHCGDNVLTAPEEECEDKFNPDCLNCWLPRMMFITKWVGWGNFGGLKAADTICQLESGYDVNTKVFEAWLSRGETTAGSRLASTSFSGRYVLFDGSVVAEGWEGLTTNSLAHAISIHADGMLLSDPDNTWTWTNTTRDGEIAISDQDCGTWKSLMGTARAGRVSALGGGWSSAASHPCSSLNRLYCVEVQP